MIWREAITIEQLNSFPPNIGTHLGIEFTEWTDSSITARMPVDDRTRQPFGILHGGASVVLAETLGSVASLLVIDVNKYKAVGLEVNANHLRPVKNGFVTGICTPLHIGGKTHIWDIKIYDEAGRLTCVSRLTVAVIAA